MHLTTTIRGPILKLEFYLGPHFSLCSLSLHHSQLKLKFPFPLRNFIDALKTFHRSLLRELSTYSTIIQDQNETSNARFNLHWIYSLVLRNAEILSFISPDPQSLTVTWLSLSSGSGSGAPQILSEPENEQQSRNSQGPSHCITAGHHEMRTSWVTWSHDFWVMHSNFHL